MISERTLNAFLCGCRTTTVILVEKNGHITFVEKTLEEPIVIGECKWKIRRHEFELQEKAAHS